VTSSNPFSKKSAIAFAKIRFRVSIERFWVRVGAWVIFFIGILGEPTNTHVNDHGQL
jgi:hypothetical protein